MGFSWGGLVGVVYFLFHRMERKTRIWKKKKIPNTKFLSDIRPFFLLAEKKRGELLPYWDPLPVRK